MGLKNLFVNFFKKRKFKDDHFLALDIGTEFVKALIVKVDYQAEKGTVISVGRQRQKFSNMLAGAVADINGVIETCQAAISQAQESGQVLCRQAVVGIAGEFIRGVTTTFSELRDNPKIKIDLAELKRLVQKIQWRSFNKIRQDFTEESGISEIEVKLINAAIIDVKIDGYRVTNPLGFQGKKLCLSIFNAFAPLIHLGALQTISRALNLKLFFVAAGPYAIARAVKKNDAIFIDIGGGTTDIALVREGGMEGMKSLALGGRAFTKRITQLLEIDFDQAEEIKLKYSQKKISSLVQRKITELFKRDINVLINGIQLSLEEFSNLAPLPPAIFLCGGGSALPGIKRKLISFDWKSKLPFIREPVVDYIKPKDLGDIVDETGQLTEPKDITPLSLASLIIDLIKAEKSPLSLIIKRSVRLLQN